MSDLVTDPKDPRLGHGVDKAPVDQHAAYLVLSAEERAKGLVRPVRTGYVHVGAPGPRYALHDLTEDQRERFGAYGYVKHEPYPESEAPKLGRFWTQAQLDKAGKGCGVVTHMSREIAETYARDPGFYGATYCCGCRMHLPVGEDGEFVWDGTSERVGA